MASNQFTEQQSIPSIWRMLIFGGTTLMIVFIAIMIYLTEWESMPEGEKPYLLLMLLGPLSTAILFVLRLDVRITQQSVEYKIHPFRKEYKVIPMSKISSIELVRPKGFKSMKGVGAHRNINQTELNFGGKYLVSLTMAKGRILTFTSNKPQELSSFLNALPEGGPKIKIAIDNKL
jgi:hypothetical protein